MALIGGLRSIEKKVTYLVKNSRIGVITMLQLYGRLLKRSKYFGSKITIDVFELS